MDTISSKTSIMTDNDNDNVNISSNRNKYQDSGSQSFDAKVKTFSEAGEIENLNVQKTPALCVSPSEDIMLKWNDKEEQITEENISGDFDIRKDDKSNNKQGSQHKLTAIDSKNLKDCKVVLEDSDSDNLNSMEIEKSELLRDKEIFATSSIENSASVIKKTLKDPNAMLEIPTYIDITDSDCQMNDDLFMSIKTDNNDLLKDKKRLKLQLESPDIIKMKKTNESEKMKKTQFNVEDDLLTSPEDEEKLLDDEPILIESDDPFPEIINITEDDDFSESTPNLARNRSVSEHKLKNALIGLETDLLAGSNLSPQKCNESDNRPTSDTDDISQSDNSFFSDIDVVLPEDSDVTKNNDTDLLLEENNIALKTDTITAPQTMLTEKKSNRAQLTTTANDEETTISTSNNEPSSDVPHCLNIDSVSNLSKMDQDISLTVSNVLTIEIDKHQKTDVHTSYTAESNNQVVKDSTILGDLKEDSLCSDTTVRNGTIKPDDAFPSTSKDSQSDTLKVDVTIPSTLKLKEQKDEPLKLDACTSNKSIPVLDSTQSIEDKIQTVQEPIASTSKTDEDVQDTSDSLGLLAELSRMMGDDEDQDEDDDGDNGDDEEEFDPDYESSNQLTAEQSEDSNTRIEGDGKEPKENDEIRDRPFEFTMDKDEQLDENTNDANDNDDVDEVTVEAQDLIDIESKLSDTSDVEENKSEDLPGEKSEKSPGAVGSDVVELDSEDETKDNSDVTTVNLPAGIDVIASRSSVVSTDIRVKEGEIIISGIPKPAALKVARLNTAEVSIKTTKLPALEVFNLDSDEDMDVDKQVVAEDTEDTAEASDAHLKHRKCVNEACPHLTNVFYVADSSSMSFYNAKKCGYVCEICAEAVVRRNERLIEGIRNFEDLVLLDLGKDLKESIEVLDSDSDDGVDSEDFAKELIGEEGAKLLEEQLADIFNEQWDKYKMDARILKSVDSLKIEMAELERQSKEVDQMLKECQTSTDNFRNELYESFKPDIKQLPPLTICDMYQLMPHETHTMETRLGKRRMSSSVEAPAKRKADGDKSIKNDPTCGIGDKADDDNTDITVVQLSTENAPPDLPPVGELERPTLRPGMPIYAMRNVFGTWGRAHIIEVNGASNSPYSMCRIKFDKSQKNVYKSLSARNLAYCEPANARMTIGTRVIALFQGSAEDVKDDKQREKFYSGIVAEVPNPVNSFRYLIFFDDGYAQYASHADTRLVCEYSSQVWEEVHPFSRLFVKEYLFNYPQRPMVRLKANETIKTEWKNKWWPSKVVKVDASLVLVQFLMGEYKARLEWIYRGSTRLEPLYREIQAAGRQRQRAMPRPQALSRPNMPIVEYMRSDEQTKSTEIQNIKEVNNEELRRQRAVAKKSTATPTPPPAPNPTPMKLDSFYSRVVYYTPKNAVRPYKITANHVCGPNCGKRKDLLSLKELLTYNPLAKPLLSGWERQIVRSKYDKRVMYRAPCGRRIRNMEELLRYLQTIKSEMGVDLFDFGPNTHCLAEFVINKYVVSKKDLANGKENVPVPCVNFYDGSLPEFCAYSTERTPTAGVPLNLDPEFLCGCDCEDDCEDKTKCACWKLTLEGARTIGLEGEDVGYVYKRLPEPLRTGIYECNSRCKCKSTCLNRVVQHPLQLKLQVFKTPNRGWGIRALNDVPKGCFICIYVGNLLTDATANLDGLNEGDEYLAELDYIEVVEQTKEGYEEDIPESIKALDKKEEEKTSEESDGEEEEDEEEQEMNQSEDEEFKPVGLVSGVTQFNKRLRKRKKDEEKSNNEVKQETEKEGNSEEGCITISDDEEVREPSRFTASDGMGDGDFVSKHRSVRKLFGEDEACYIMDAKVQGNIGRYLNHSCCPNVFVQNVFVDTHDPRFPWVAFFASTHIKAGKELTWNYNYDIGSVPGKVLYCYCGEPNCRGRLL